ncbi:hypothetical protein IFM89_022233, partial [Coptis chinensis]
QCSGAGLHVGHPLGYTTTDILARYKRMQGFNVLHPMGWDAFGLPAEQYAIQIGTHPKVTTMRNIERFRPKCYQLVPRSPRVTVLANEEVINGVSERGGHPVIRKPMHQWMLKITAYVDRLLEDLDGLDLPESIKDMQRNWIGRSEGAEVEFCILNRDGHEKGVKLTVYTTRPDTIFGATKGPINLLILRYLVVTPEHPLLSSILSDSHRKCVEEYRELASRRSELERIELHKEKTGVFSGSYARNPASGEAIPIWVADYVLGSAMVVPRTIMVVHSPRFS